MATYVKFNSFVEALAEKVHDLSSDQIKIALCATANIPVASDTVLTDLVEISYTNLSARDVTTVSSSQTGGTYKLVLDDLTLTVSGGSVSAFQYIVLYNDTAAGKELIGFYDYGSSVVLADGDQFILDFSAVNGVIQIV